MEYIGGRISLKKLISGLDATDQIDPGAHVHVERVRNTSVGRRDHWRKP
jgi:hypothetical protein